MFPSAGVVNLRVLRSVKCPSLTCLRNRGPFPPVRCVILTLSCALASAYSAPGLQQRVQEAEKGGGEKRKGPLPLLLLLLLNRGLLSLLLRAGSGAKRGDPATGAAVVQTTPGRTRRDPDAGSMGRSGSSGIPRALLYARTIAGPSRGS